MLRSTQQCRAWGTQPKGRVQKKKYIERERENSGRFYFRDFPSMAFMFE